MNVMDAIKTKRAIRVFTEQPLPREDIEDIVNAGRLAQSSKNMQAWHFIAITDRQILKDLSECGQFAGHIAGAAMAVAILTPDPGLRFNVMFDAGQSAAYMQLAAHEKGIGSCLATIYERERARELLGFPEDLHIRIAISFGYPDPEKKRTGRRTGRRLFEEVASWDRWPADHDAYNPFEEQS